MDTKMKEKEYDTLRQEIMHWQSRRFSVVTGSLVVVIAILGWAINAPDKWSWTIVSSILLAILSIAGYMTWLIGLLTSRISTYLEVFHEANSVEVGWERRHRAPKRNFLSSKGAYSIMYLGVGVISFIVSRTVCQVQPSVLSRVLFFPIMASFLSMVSVLAFGKRPWKRYVEEWEQIKNLESIGGPTKTADKPQSPPKEHSEEELKSRFHNLVYSLFYPAVLGTVFMNLLPISWQLLLVLFGYDAYKEWAFPKWFLAMGIVLHFSVDYFFAHKAPKSFFGFAIDLLVLLVVGIAASNLRLNMDGVQPSVLFLCVSLSIVYGLFIFYFLTKRLPLKKYVLPMEGFAVVWFFILAVRQYSVGGDWLWLWAGGSLYLFAGSLGWVASRSLKAIEGQSEKHISEPSGSINEGTELPQKIDAQILPNAGGSSS